MILENVEGVSTKKEQILNSMGIELAEDLAMLNPAKTEEVDGLSPTIISNAIDHIGYDHKYVDSEQLNYECGFCGKNYRLRAQRALKMHQDRCEENPEAEDSGVGTYRGGI